MAEAMKTEPESKVERAKRGSRGLRGTIAETLAAGRPAFGDDDVQVLKFHGIYQGDDRDHRRLRRLLEAETRHWFMVRARIPGGRLDASQYLALDRLAEEVSYNGSLRLTTRQSIQLHGILVQALPATIRRMNEALVSTLAACGDVERNVMASPVPFDDPAQPAVQQLAREIARELAPRTGAYHEIWLEGERVASGDEEALYGDAYLPRKLKTAVGLPTDAALDLHSQDIGLVAVAEGSELRGANLLVGGGLGMTHRKADTFARLGSPLGFVSRDRVVAAVRAIVETFRDHGNRSDRRHARLKYVVEEWGDDRFRAELEKRAGFALEPWVEVGPLRFRDVLGPHPQGDGRFFYGIFVENGRVIDDARRRTKTALREIVAALRPGIALSPDQNLVLTDLAPGDVERVESVLDAYGVARPASLPGLRRFALACPALPTCGLALTEAERALPGVLDELEPILARHGLEDEPITVRMTGCPNGCARPYTADLGLVGRGIDEYDVYVGGGLAGDRLGELWLERVGRSELAPALAPLVARWAAGRLPDEALGDWFQRARDLPRRTLLTGVKEPLAP